MWTRRIGGDNMEVLDFMNSYVATLIRWHMTPCVWERNNDEKMHEKYKNLWGEDLYNDVMKLHKADMEAH